MSPARSLRMHYRNATWVVGPRLRCHQGIDERIHRTQLAEPKERPIVCPRDANQRILPDSIEPYPRIQMKCVQGGFSLDNPEIPEHMTNTLGINMEQLIPFFGAKTPYVITHMRAGHGMTRKEGRNAPAPKRVWYTTDHTSVDKAILQRNELHEGGQKLTIACAGPKSQTQCIDFDMAEYVIHWARVVRLPIVLATGLMDNGWKIRDRFRAL